MTSDWPLHSLSDFIKIKHGFAFKGEFFRSEKTSDYLVTPGNFSIGGGFKADKFKYYDGPVPEDYVLDEGDLVVTMTDLSKQADTLGYSAFIPSISEHRLLHNQRVGLVEFKNDELDKTYLYFLLRSREYRNHVLGGVTGTTVKHTSPIKILSYEFRVPPFDIQRYIGKKLIGLEYQIELNRQTNQTLKEMVQAIFKSWFIDFEPTRAKIAAKQNGQDPERASMASISGKTIEELDQLTSEQQQSLKTTAALFPDTLVDSELGEIPERWSISDLKSVTIELRRGISPKYSEEKGILVINQKCIRNHTVNFDLARLNDPSKRKIDGRQIELGDVLVNSTGVGTLGRLAPVRFLPELTVFDSHVTVVRADTAKISQSFLAGLMLEKEKYIEASGAGSTGQTELRKQVLEEIIFVKPSIMAGQLFESIVSPMNKQIAELEQQHKVLSKVRDLLLPKLLSGALDINKKDAA